MVENTCFICFTEINDDRQQFDELEYFNFTCNCYQHKSMHIDCFNDYLKINPENENKCAYCRSIILSDNTAFIRASAYGRTEIGSMLLEKGADVNAMNDDGNTALIVASEYGHKEIVELIKKHMYQENIIKAVLVTKKGRTKYGRPLVPHSQQNIASSIASFGGKTKKSKKSKKTLTPKANKTLKKKNNKIRIRYSDFINY